MIEIVNNMDNYVKNHKIYDLAFNNKRRKYDRTPERYYSYYIRKIAG